MIFSVIGESFGFILIAMQNDLGTLLVFMAIFGGVALVSGVTWRILGPVIAAVAAIGITLLALVTSATGKQILDALGFKLAAATGAKSWFVFGPVSFQPSEVVKPAFILMLSRVVAQHNRQYEHHDVHSDWLLLGKMALCFLPVAVLNSQYGTMQSALRATIVQGVFWILGAIIIAFLLRFDASQLWRLAPVAYGLGIFLLVAVLIFYNRGILYQ
ncbi:hypothetical protein GQS40_00660|uniref:Uncharacterized protein n=1 Tax=Leuconostoc lactis TaxID=1246 RepID=A0A6L7A9S3_LEULA|nr:hypothetical protein [Leuconostoc lactis]